MDSINYYFKSETKKDSGMKYLFQTLYMIQNKIWKGRKKEKDSPTTPEEQKEYLDDRNIRNRISDADLFRLSALPPMVDLNEWLATHTIAFFNHVNLIYGVVTEYCTAETCSSMTAPDNVQYFWYDDKGKKNKHTAPQYIDYVMSHIQKITSDESVFPTKYGQEFPPDFEATVKRIHKYLFHVLAHIYHAHYKLLRQLELNAHLNTLFTHFMVFTSKFDLVQDKESDILLLLFSLLLKNLADPNQNPKLREGLGLGDCVNGSSREKTCDISRTEKGESSPLVSSEWLGNGDMNLRFPHCNLVANEDSLIKNNGLKQHSLSFGTIYSHFSSEERHRKQGEIMIETEPVKYAPEWLSNLQVSAT